MITKPIEFAYKTTPYEHQRTEFEKSRSWKYYAFFWEMGTGKTKPLLDTAAWLFTQAEIDGLLLISDKGSYLNWALNEIPRHMPDNIPIRVVVWSSTMGKEQAKKCEKILIPKDDLLDIACINIEALSTKRGYEWAKKFLESHYGLTVIDESTSIKNPKSLRTKSALALGKISEYRRIATGTPVTQGPLDIFGQCEFLQQGLLGHVSFVSFRSQYAIMRDVILGTRRFQTIAGYCRLDNLEAKVKQFSSRLTKKECLDLPDKVYEVQYIEMSPEQLQVYRQLKDEAVVLLKTGLLSSTNAITTIGKLHQICCGHVRDDNGLVTEFKNGRLDALIEALENIPGKVIIWGYYQHDIEMIHAALTNHFRETGSYPVHYYGKTTPEERIEALSKFTTDKNCRWFIGSPSTGGKGLTLVQAHHVIYYSCGYNLEHRLQSEDRCHRIGQVNKVTYIDFTTVGTIEAKIVKALKNKKDLAHELLDARRLQEFFEDDLP